MLRRTWLSNTPLDVPEFQPEVVCVNETLPLSTLLISPEYIFQLLGIPLLKSSSKTVRFTIAFGTGTVTAFSV